MRIAVTGASGRLAGKILKHLHQLGHTAIAISRQPAAVQVPVQELRLGDYNDYNQLVEVFAGVEVLVLTAAMEAPDLREVQHRNAIFAAKAAGVRKVVYTSAQGPETGKGYAPLVLSHRQTEQDLMESGLQWIIGRNGLYMEHEIENLEQYIAQGGLYNCAGEGRCNYTTREQLGEAYAHLAVNDQFNEQILNLHGESLTQAQLVTYLNQTFGLDLSYKALSVEDYLVDRRQELGDELGQIWCGLYQGILEGAFASANDFTKAVGHRHQNWASYFARLHSHSHLLGYAKSALLA